MIKVFMSLCILAVSLPSLGMKFKPFKKIDMPRETKFSETVYIDRQQPDLSPSFPHHTFSFTRPSDDVPISFIRRDLSGITIIPGKMDDKDWAWLKKEACKRAGNKKAESKFIASQLTQQEDFYMGEPPVCVSPLDVEELWALGLLLSGEKGSILNPLIDPVD